MKNYHSRSYHRFFEGYTEKGIVNEKGNYQIVRVYTGDYYEPCYKNGEKKKYETIVTLCYCMAAALFFVSGVQRTAVNLLLPAALFQSIALWLLVLLARSVIYLWIEKPPYTVRKYRLVSEKMKSYSRVCAVFCWLTAAVMAVAWICLTASGHPAKSLSSLLCIAGFLACGLLLYTIFAMENHVAYRRKKSSEVRPEKGVDIVF